MKGLECFKLSSTRGIKGDKVGVEVYWDSSALVPILLPESRSKEMISLLGSDGEPTVWWGSSVECLSAIYRRHREHPLARENLTRALERLETIRTDADIVTPSEEIRIRAGRLLNLHPLGAADALQLAAALVWIEEKPAGERFICLDEKLRGAARREGFRVVPDAAP